MVKIIVMPKALNSLPTIPLKKAMGEKTAIVVITPPIIEKDTSFAPIKAASIGGTPWRRCRVVFSSTTVVASTTMPTEREIAIMESAFKVISSLCMTIKLPKIQTGMVTIVTKVALKVCRNRNIKMEQNKTAHITSLAAPPMAART